MCLTVLLNEHDSLVKFSIMHLPFFARMRRGIAKDNFIKRHSIFTKT